jgi:hypothetical protein
MNALVQAAIEKGREEKRVARALAPSVAHVLALVNKIRAAWKLPALEAMPVGECGSRFDCPLTRALEARQYRFGVIYFQTTTRMRQALAVLKGTEARASSIVLSGMVCPAVFNRFVAGFDAGAYPDLIEERKKK